jgi:peptidoglycan/LPS O-acetylase OafA/YrhL
LGIGEEKMNRISEFDMMKGFAIILILIGHLKDYIGFDLVAGLQPYMALFGLSLFVFSSGFTIYLNNPNPEVKTFYLKRLWRIYPLYAVALLAYSILYFNNNLSFWAIHLFGLQCILAPQYTTPIVTLWFIGLIIVFYAVYPFIIKFSQLLKRKMLGIIISSILILSCMISIKLFFNILDSRILLFFPLFVIGILFASHQKIQIRFMDPLLAALFLISLYLFILIGSPNIIIPETSLAAYPLAVVLSSSMCLTALALFHLAKQSEKLVKFFLYLSVSSYCIYLFHRPILAAMGGNLWAVIIAAILLPVPCYSIQKDYNKIAQPRRENA